MRSTTAILVVGSALVLGACEERSETPTPSGGTANTPAGGVSGALDAAKGTASDAFGKMRDQAVAAMEPRLADAKAQVVKFRDKLAALPEAARPTVDSAITEVEKQMTAAGEQLTKLKTAGSDTWQSISTELGTAMDKLGTAIKDLTAKFPS